MGSREELTDAIKTACVKRDGRLTLRCADAFQVAKKASSDLATIGRICNENGIKVVQCQLGCFK